MELSALIFIIGSTLAWCTLDVLRKFLARGYDSLTLTFIFTTGCIPLFFGWFLVEGGRATSSEYLAPALGAAALGVSGSILFILSVRYTPLSHSIPFLALTPVITALFGLLLGEFLAPLQVVGVLAILIGGLYLHPPILAETAGFRFFERIHVLRGEKGSLLMCAAACCWGISPILDKVALQLASVPFHGAFTTFAGAIMLLFIICWRKRLSHLMVGWSNLPLLLLAVVVLTLALGLQFIAILEVHVSTFEAIKRAVSIASSVLVGKWLFDEALTRRKFVCCSAMAVGVVLVLV